MENACSKVASLSNSIQRHPYQSLLVAAGVGYVLGGGLFTRLTMRMLRVGIRMGALPIVQRGLLGVADAALSASTNAAS